jgi:peroxiredoxin
VIRLAAALFAAAAAIKTGPAPGEKIPAFEAIDQNGNKQTLASIAGPKGAMLVFYRSADW